MDRQQLESLLILAGLLIFLAGFALAAFIFPRLTPELATAVLTAAILILLGTGFILSRFVRAYIFGARRLAEELKLVMTVNPAHRVRFQGPDSLQTVAEAINTFADRLQSLLDEQTTQVEQARSDVKGERNKLATLMSELTVGVLVCNLEGQILLYNNQARHLLKPPAGPGVGGFVGLGRSVFGLIDRNAITHALEDLAFRHEKQSLNLVSQFVATATNGSLIRVRMAPILTQQGDINGFILTLEDITQRNQASIRRDILLQTLTEGIRSSLANIRAAIETIEEYPQMDAARVGQLRKVIYDESLTLSAKLNQTTAEYAADLKADWQLEEMLGNDLLWAIQRRLEDKFAAEVTIETQDDSLWLKVDSYSVVQAMTFVMRCLKTDFGGVERVTLRLRRTGHLAALDLSWETNLADLDTLWSWQNQPMMVNGEGISLTLQEVAERHGGEIWCQAGSASGTAYFRLLLPLTQPKRTWNIQVVQESRPEYYDFDLFHQPGQKPELDERPLTELAYTVFDTETTGMNPSEGDEIISLSAVRVVNMRLLRQEIFDQLIDPRRPVSPDSIKIHSIEPEILKGQPTIEQVLPLFHRFSEGTVLVAHNAAFDMRLLQLKEAQTGVKFINPVLDTLLLSAVIHPNQDGHSLEAIAQRLGINTIGRHTSLGDAILTGEIFLNLVPLLAEKNILTLKDARRAAQDTYYARLKY